MRKLKNFESELKALDERARQLRTRKLHQFGELVASTGADALPIDVLAGALLSAAEAKDAGLREGWRARGAAFFRPIKQKQNRAAPGAGGAPPNDGGALPRSDSAGAK